ncbi:DUF2303 family protein [Aureimonas phyllosphaerae]|uniref:Uncharacterized protein YfdQ (DUF2303 family) n=1 Tax=Aureimonas phyllosphaerae TaxID=1166078 RepID=A0A7W6C1S1_9HYPH|nr:DUF2303 family protein [Aureimonas phyllosphaerae]MBB3937901.1 uncharacterized protein YfdQ (DUF2303 family) [Aureimonas phyllosphaerae]MBB3961926.1 uncharacterized protein YfdQ (DUF2303 family) [Aureimonas phyllosphaerae]SFF54745.1 Uncharacterized conserved protein YfdQ, DUF2303 family [Aureimonas phyllosphaerae]
MAETTTPTPMNEPIVGEALRLETIRIDGDAVEKLASLGSRATGVEIEWIDTPAELLGLPDSFPVAVVHGDKPEVRSIKALADEYRLYPEFRRGVAQVGDVASLIDLLNRQKLESSVVFAISDWKKPSLTAVVDYHDLARRDGRGDANWGKHRLHYAFPFSDEWRTWLAHDGKPMDQAEFAEFVEERAPDMIALVEAENAHHARELQVDRIGSPIQIFELARGLEINVGGKVKQNIKLQSGEAKISFEESHTGRDGAPITVPGAFALSIPLFYNEEPITIPVRLRYRLIGGAIVWTYKLFRVDRLVAEAVKLAKDEVREKTGLPVYEGAPEMLADGRILTGAGGA